MYKEQESYLDLTAILLFIVKHRIVIGVITFGVGVLAVIAALVMTELFCASTTILPNSDSSSELKKVAALAGVSVVDYGENSSILYPQILKSRRILEDALNSKYQPLPDMEKIRLIDFWIPDTDISESLRLALLLKKMRQDVVSVETDEMSGLISVHVTTEYPRLSAGIANKLTALLDQYNRNFRKAKATEQRAFIEERLIEVKQDLEQAENRVKYFREQNRKVIDSPNLLLEQERLLRDVELQNTLYIELKKQYELVKLEEVKNTPLITILDKAHPPEERCSPKRKLIVVISTFLGFLCALAFAYIRSYWQNLRMRLKHPVKSHN